MGLLSDLFWMLFSFRGRLSRLGYVVGGVLSESVIVAFFALFAPFTQDSHSTAAVWIISTESVPLIWTNVALMAKRLHDCGYSGLWSVLCSPLCLLLFLFVSHYNSPLLLGAASLASLLAIVFLTTVRENKPNEYGMPTSGIFPRAYLGHMALKQLADKLETLDQQLAAGQLTAAQHTEACKKLLDAHKGLLE